MSSVQNGRIVANVPVPQTRPQARPTSQSYTVKAGDSLWNIAKANYGDGMKWTDIYANNKDIIGKNPDLIQPGMQLELKGLAPAETASQPEVLPETDSETSLNEITPQNSGSAVPTVDLFDEEMIETAPVVVDTAETAPVVVDTAETAPVVVDTPETAPVVVDTAETAPVVVDTPETAPVVVDTAETAPVVVDTAETAPVVDSSGPAPLVDVPVPKSETIIPVSTDTSIVTSAPTALPNPTVPDQAPINPMLAQADSLLAVIDGKGFSVAHHGDPVGGIPKVSKAMDQVLAMSNDGSISQMPEGASKQKMQGWAQEIVTGRLAQAGNKFDGISAKTTQQVNDLLNNPAFANLPTDKQDRLLEGLRTGFDLMQYAPGQPTAAHQELQARLAEHFQAPISDIAPVVNSEAPGQINPAETLASPPLVNTRPDPKAGSRSAPIAPKAASEEAAPKDPTLLQAEAILTVIDGKGYSVASHGDPVGGIPKVSRAMDQVLAMSKDGSIAQMPEGASKQKMQNWAQDIVTGRLAQAGNKFDGITEKATRQVNELLNNPAFSSLPADKQERLLEGLRSGFDLMQYAPGEPSSAHQELQARLNSHFGVAELSQSTQAIPPSDVAPVIHAEAPSPISPPLNSAAAPVIKSMPEPKPVTPPAPQAPAAVSVEPAPIDPSRVQAEQLLAVIDGKGYTVAHHGDPVGGIPRVSKAMDQVLAMSKDGSIAQMPEGASKQKMQDWAQDIVTGRLAQASNNFDGITPRITQHVNELINNPAFASLPADKQERLLDGLRSGFKLMPYAPGEPSAAQLALEQRLQKHFGSAESEVKAASPQAMTETQSAAEPEQTSLAEFEQSLKQKASLFGGSAKQDKILSQGQRLFAASPEQQQAASQSLSDSQYYQELGQLLAQTSDAVIAQTLTRPSIRGVDVMKEVDNQIAGQLLIALANEKPNQADAEELIASTLKAFDGIFKDREKPFEILQASAAFQNLSPELQADIKALLKFF